MNHPAPPVFADLQALSEEEKIALIGRTVMSFAKTVAVAVDDDAKAERYIAKLRAGFPDMVILGKFPGPVAGVVMLKVGPPNLGRN